MEHEFTSSIISILNKFFGEKGAEIFERSYLLQYINLKTRSANRGSKSRGSFANLYAIYVLVEDYINQGYDKVDGYSESEGSIYTKLLKRQRELPFGNKLQNHALNHRMNEEFRKFFPQCEFIPILRDTENNRYWINENLLKVQVSAEIFNIARAVIEIIGEYIKAKRSSFEAFIQTCEQLKTIAEENDESVEKFIVDLLAPNVDARLFEIVSFSILKYFYHDRVVYFGFSRDSIEELNLKLYKTGRTNANDGGIDFVMKPLGRFFQVTETLDVKKYFLDIEKIERYPISFVIKSEQHESELLELLEAGARKLYSVETIVRKYISCIEEIINIPILKSRFQEAKREGYLPQILDEIIGQSKVEFNYED